jgi:hypothetical protein
MRVGLCSSVSSKWRHKPFGFERAAATKNAAATGLKVPGGSPKAEAWRGRKSVCKSASPVVFAYCNSAVLSQLLAVHFRAVLCFRLRHRLIGEADPS